MKTNIGTVNLFLFSNQSNINLRIKLEVFFIFIFYLFFQSYESNKQKPKYVSHFKYYIQFINIQYTSLIVSLSLHLCSHNNAFK